jgi:hypothetical protein
VKKPLFSILHTSARPHRWKAVYDDWMDKAVHPDDVEYVLCVDPRWGFSLDPREYATPLDNILVVQNTGRQCYVDGVNLAAEASSGQVLIVNADDQFACPNWDNELFELLATETMTPADERVIEVDTGTPDEHQRSILVMPILTRSRYQRLGYVFYPEYESMYADNDLCEHARQDGVLIDARHLHFSHKHYLSGARQADAADYAQTRAEAFAIGHQVLEKRRANGFQPIPPAKRSIALCLSGERFEGPWMDGLLTLYGHLIQRDFSILRAREFAYTSNVYVTRSGIRRAVLNSLMPGGVEHEHRPELCLWLDDDNILSPEHFDRLLADLDAHPDVDGVAGYCWIHNQQKQGFMLSCGEWAPDHLHWQPFPASFVHEGQPRQFETGGMPCLLMRTATLEKAGDDCFLPILDSRLEHGLTGEDISFFLSAERAGCRFLVDPQVRVPHLKYVAVEPVFPEEGKVPVKVACMIRARNEARWIWRTIQSVLPLCGSDIYVMEDGSTDDTVAVAEAAGAIVLPSPFAGQGLDERRDKNWLLEEVRQRCQADWILMPDGDEELEPGGCDKIRRALETNPPVDCFALRFLTLWDSIDTVRLDGIYGTNMRQSLFRANSNLKFRSYYEGEGENHNHVGLVIESPEAARRPRVHGDGPLSNKLQDEVERRPRVHGDGPHVGLHTSNAPGLGGMRVAPLNVFLVHYGYLHKQDRVRKYRWITELDPHNEREDFYRHTVQGDIPEVPSDAKLKHAGPLLLQKLPARLVPKWKEVPGPRDGVFTFGEKVGSRSEEREGLYARSPAD